MNTRARIVLSVVLVVLAVFLTVLAPKLSVSAENAAPVAENLEFKTYRNVSVGGRLAAVDPDGDVLTYVITTEPTKGTVEVAEDGRFVYSPNANKRGRDYFGYKATDANGDTSQEATVIIRIEKQKTAVTYDDMTGDGRQYAAVSLAERGLFTGEKLGETWLFFPEREVSRGEFLAMCMQLTDEDMLTGVMTTGFYDDADIPQWQKVYVATAMMDNIVTGYTGGEGVVFAATDPVTYSEAAVMLNNVLELTDVSAMRWAAAAPAWALQATANLSACGIMPEVGEYESVLSRADAAEMLVSAMDVLENR